MATEELLGAPEKPTPPLRRARKWRGPMARTGRTWITSSQNQQPRHLLCLRCPVLQAPASEVLPETRPEMLYKTEAAASTPRSRAILEKPWWRNNALLLSPAVCVHPKTIQDRCSKCRSSKGRGRFKNLSLQRVSHSALTCTP